MSGVPDEHVPAPALWAGVCGHRGRSDPEWHSGDFACLWARPSLVGSSAAQRS